MQYSNLQSAHKSRANNVSVVQIEGRWGDKEDQKRIERGRGMESGRNGKPKENESERIGFHGKYRCMWHIARAPCTRLHVPRANRRKCHFAENHIDPE